MRSENPNLEIYRGYVIMTNPLNGGVWVQKSGAHVCWASSREDARKSVDSLFETGETYAK